jgi:hypothetical protein
MVRKLLCLICFVFVAMLLVPANALAVVSVVDTFNSYSLGLVNTNTGGVWTEAFNRGAASATIAGVGNQYLRTAVPGLVDQTDAVWRALPTPILSTDATTTMYLRFRAETATQNTSFGLSTVASPVGYQNGSFGEYGNQIRVSVQGGILGVGARGVGGTGGTWSGQTPIVVGQWYNIWAVITRTGVLDNFDLYMKADAFDGTGAVESDKILSGMGFRLETAAARLAPLVTFMAMPQGSASLPNTYPLDMDDIYLKSGKDLSIPEPATMVLLGLGSLALLKRRKS